MQYNGKKKLCVVTIKINNITYDCKHIVFNLYFTFYIRIVRIFKHNIKII